MKKDEIMGGKKPLQREAALAETAQGRANLYDLLVGAFVCLPDKELVRKIKSRDLQDFLDICCSLDNITLETGVKYIKSYRASLQPKSDEEILTELSVDRTGLLRATSNTELKPPYEGLWKNDQNSGASVLAVKNCYREAGLLPDETVLESPDYLCVELDFMYHLCRREQEQWASAADAGETVAAEERFLREHLGSWVGEFCSQAEKHALTDYYRGFLMILDAIICIDMEYLGNLIPTLSGNDP
ncbi:molecular chaperone [Chloroflexota bacterium]